MRRLLPLVGAFYALLAAHPARAEATERVFTCVESESVSWQMTQPAEHYLANLWPTWDDCLAWRDGDPGPSYVWSYGQTAPTTSSTTTTTSSTTTTTPVPETTTTSSTTTSLTTTTTQPIATSTSTSTTTTIETPIQTVATTTSTTLEKNTESTSEPTTVPIIESTSTSSSTSTTTPDATITPETITPATTPREPGGLAEGASNALAPGVTPEAQRAIVAASLGLITSSAASSRRRR